MARTIPKGAERGPRDRQVSVYLSAEEVEALAVLAREHGFKSKSTLLAYLLEDLLRDGLTATASRRFAEKLAQRKRQSPKRKAAQAPVQRPAKRAKKPSPYAFEIAY